MAYLTKANTKLKQELEKKITAVLESFTYDEILLEDEKELEEYIFPFRYYTRQNGGITAVLMGEGGLLGQAEILTTAVNSMLGAEISDFTLQIGYGALCGKYAVQGEPSVLDEIEEEDDTLDDLRALCDILEGYGLGSYVSVNLTGEKQGDGLFFACCAGKQMLCKGVQQGNSIRLEVNLMDLTKFKLGGKTLKDPVPVVLVASDLSDTAYKVAFGLRQQGLQAEGYITGGSMIEAEEYCALKGIPALIWAGDQKVIMKNIQSGELAETTLEKLLGKK